MSDSEILGLGRALIIALSLGGCFRNEGSSANSGGAQSATPPSVISTVSARPLETPAIDQYRERMEIYGMVRAVLSDDNSGTASMQGHCSSELGSVLVECNPQLEVALQRVIQQTTVSLEAWRSVSAVLPLNDPESRYVLTVHVEGLSDANRILRDRGRRSRNRDIESRYNQGVMSFGRPRNITEHIKPGLNQQLACVRGFEILERLRSVIQSVRDLGPHHEVDLQLVCTEASARGPEFRGANVEIRSRFDLPRPQIEQTLQTFARQGYQRL